MKHLWILACWPSLLMASDYSEVGETPDPAALAIVEPFLPADLRILALAQGDLNNDKRPDYAFAIEREASETKPYSRRFYTLLSDPDVEGAWSISNQYWHFLPKPADDGTEPLAYVAIYDGLLELKFVPSNAGRSHVTYTFKRKGPSFALQNWQRYQVNPATAMFKEHKIDLLAGQEESSAGSMSSPRHRKETLAFKAAQIWTPCHIKDVFSFEP